MAIINSHSGLFTLQATQEVTAPLNTTWQFFSNPHNLLKITPPNMHFKITSQTQSRIYNGQIITYRVNVLPFYTANWVSEIYHVKEKSFFVDVQRIGPYKLWHHAHFFEEVTPQLTRIHDTVTYKPPFLIIGKVAHTLFIKKRLLSIFNFRAEAVEKIFSKF